MNGSLLQFNTPIPYIVVQNVRDGTAIIFDKNPNYHISNLDDVDIVKIDKKTHLRIGMGLIMNLPDSILKNIEDPHTNLKIFEMDMDNISRAWIV